jgi:hypothetical protein
LLSQAEASGNRAAMASNVLFISVRGMFLHMTCVERPVAQQTNQERNTGPRDQDNKVARLEVRS